MASLLGVVCYGVNYALLSLHVFDGDSVGFFLGNTVAAVLVLVSNAVDFNLASVMVQLFFIAIGFCAMIWRFLEDTSEGDREVGRNLPARVP
ncbi:MAG: hypothetical protein AAFR73_01065 [Pseudomonadota bacterium]